MHFSLQMRSFKNVLARYIFFKVTFQIDIVILKLFHVIVKVVVTLFTRYYDNTTHILLVHFWLHFFEFVQ